MRRNVAMEGTLSAKVGAMRTSLTARIHGPRKSLDLRYFFASSTRSAIDSFISSLFAFSSGAYIA